MFDFVFLVDLKHISDIEKINKIFHNFGSYWGLMLKNIIEQ